MTITDFTAANSVINQYMAELRDKSYQKNRQLFRHNIQRIGELMAYELSKTLDYTEAPCQTGGWHPPGGIICRMNNER